MSAALVIVYICLGAVEVAVVVAWVVATRRHRWPVRPSAGDVLIGGATSFLDTLGIGNYAQITALFKLRGHPPDELIPGTLNVGNAVGILLSSTLFITAVRVEPVLLMAMVISAGAGAWIGAGIVSRMPRRRPLCRNDDQAAACPNCAAREFSRGGRREAASDERVNAVPADLNADAQEDKRA